MYEQIEVRLLKTGRKRNILRTIEDGGLVSRFPEDSLESLPRRRGTSQSVLFDQKLKAQV